LRTPHSVNQFLNDFKIKMKVFDIYFRDERGKNTQALLDLEITPIKRKEIIANLESIDYSQGPVDDQLYGNGSLWVFGKLVKEQEVYIKICMGRKNNRTICVSFHIAERKMTYPFKTKN